MSCLEAFFYLGPTESLVQASDLDLQLYLLQLVQALKYENYTLPTPATLSYEDPTLASQTARSEETLSGSSAPSLPPVNMSVEEVSTSNNVLGNDDENISLSSFLIHRACCNSSLANYFYWYLLTECEEQEGGMKKDAIVQDMYKSVLNRFLSTLETGSASLRARKSVLERQHAFLDRIVNLVKTVARESGNRKKKIEKFQSLLLESEDSSEFSYIQFDVIPFPLDPAIQINGIVAEKATLFKSSLMPAKITFTTESGEEYVAIFKNGDDLRQDQLILQVHKYTT